MKAGFDRQPVRMFIDTSVLVYAFCHYDAAKSKIAKKLIKRVFDGEISVCISNQVIAELSNVLLKKFGAAAEDVYAVVKSINADLHFIKLVYNSDTVLNVLQVLKSEDFSFFDLLISETMKENGISTIITENEKDFVGVSGVNVINPFK